MRFLLSALFLAVVATASATTLKISPNSTTRSATEVEANYTTTHLFVDEVAGDQIPITVFFDPQTTGIQACEVITNLNRRSRAQVDADGDGIEDGIKPPSANILVAGDDSNYYKAYAMTGVTGGYEVTLNGANVGATKTGAYRLTARYRFNTENAQTPGPWHYYNEDGGHRDHAFVITPKQARDITLYEVNVLTVAAEGTLSGQRSTFSDLANGLGSGHSPRFSLNYVKDLGANMLWFQPIHPNGIDGRQIDGTTGQPFEVGSPYAVKNFFEVMPLMARGFTAGTSPSTNDTPAGRAAAMTEFQSFAAAADAANVGIMLDAPFNHTSYDAELATLGQQYFGNAGTNANTELRNTEARFFSRTDNYDMRAFSSGSIAVAPDRYDFGKFADTYDVYYGRYAALVPNGGTGDLDPIRKTYLNEEDWFDYSIGDDSLKGSGNGHFDTLTQNVWRYFASYTLYWLDRTGYPANASGASLNSNVGIDALRADFGQGLPPQCWEYIINRTRTRKWNFMFMAESLDGHEVTYRSARHFDILNENIVFPFHAATNTTAYRTIFEDRRNAYGQALVLLNSSSHDEDHYKDPFEALIRYAVANTIDGIPLVFPGQELGLSGDVVPPGDTQKDPNGDPLYPPFGYDRYEVNFGKPIPHFKKFNSLMPLWNKTKPGDGSYNYGLAQLAPVFQGIGAARRFSPALRSSNRYFLNLNDNTPHGQIFSVAKFEQRNVSPAAADVVFAFVNVDRNATPITIGTNKYNVNIDADANGQNDFGIKRGRKYNVRNIAAYLGVNGGRRDTLLIPGGISGDDLLDKGLFVSLNKVPTDDPSWGTAPYEPQYLKLYDVTDPGIAPGTAGPANAYGYALGTSATVSWTASPSEEGVVPCYIVTVTIDGDTQIYYTCATNYTFDGTIGHIASVTVQPVNPYDTSRTGPSSAAATVKFIDPNADEDGDGLNNAAENTAATNPFDPKSVLRITGLVRASATSTTITWNSVPGKQYEIQKATTLTGTNPFSPIGPIVNGSAGVTTSYEDTTNTPPPAFYRVRVLP
jgi:glycosidase